MADHERYSFEAGEALLRILACQIVQVALSLQDQARTQSQPLDFQDAVSRAGTLLFEVTPRVGSFLENLENSDGSR